MVIYQILFREDYRIIYSVTFDCDPVHTQLYHLVALGTHRDQAFLQGRDKGKVVLM